LYTQALSDELAKPGIGIYQLLEDVRRAVNQGSKGAQIPTEISTMVQPFVLNPRSPEAEAWDLVRDSTDPAAIEEFRRKFPNSSVSGQAALRIEELEWQRASQAHTADSLRGFISKFPASPHASQAKLDLANLDKAAQATAGRALVNEALQRYRDAFGNRDLEALKAVWPSLTRNEMGAFQNFFRAAKTVKLDLTPLAEPEVTGDSATVRCRRVVTAADDRGALPPQDQTVTIQLRKSGAGMVIDSIRAQSP
jgi:hypothetical protein